MHQKRTIIVGGVAGGASAAARLRRNDETMDIVMFERGSHVSFANCGLPYYVGGVIQERKHLLITTPQEMADRFKIEVRVETTVTAIKPATKKVEWKKSDGTTGEDSYDFLVLAPGAAPVRPPLPGIDLPGIFTIRRVTDVDWVTQWIEEQQVQKAVVVGAGFVVTVIDLANQVLPPLDPEMAYIAQKELKKNGVKVVLGDSVEEFRQGDGASAALCAITRNGLNLQTDMVVLSIGVRPEIALANDAGLDCSRGIVVDERMRTSDPYIYAVGDAVESKNIVTEESSVFAMAGPANRMGRIAADNITSDNRDINAVYKGWVGSAVCGIFGLTVASTGCSEKTLERAQWPAYASIYLHPFSHAEYYPGAARMHMKLIFDPKTGRILGCQAVGSRESGGTEKRIDVIATLMQFDGTVHHMEDVELCYAPQFGSAKDPVNFAGQIASNVIRGYEHTVTWRSLLVDNPQPEPFVIDVRDPEEVSKGTYPKAHGVPFSELRGRMQTLPTDRPIYVFCESGQRSHSAVRMLRANGLNAFNLSGGYQSYLFCPSAHQREI
eukprot:Clim_evm3s95 gene=Clim_evmTU3s95